MTVRMDDRLFDSGPGTGSERSPAEPSIASLPLAARMRPQSLDEVIGQDHIVGEGTALRSAIASSRPHSAILYGPPGSGKTTLARIIARVGGDFAFEEASAVNAGRAEIKEVIERARERQRGAGRRTVLFLDEIHRFNKAQQDALLPAVEDGTLTLIGATTENPYFEVNPALISRCHIYELNALGAEETREILERALSDSDRGVHAPVPVVDDEALDLIAQRAGGDARSALSALERACETARDREIVVDVELAADALQKAPIRYDRQGDAHYDYISAWIKATRGSDPDASIYYLAAMLEAGEDPRFIARRMVILASEDVGNADPRALLIAEAAAAAVDRVGLPECRINLAQAAVYLARAPKSNASYMALEEASALIRREGTELPPDYLRDAHYSGAKELGRGVGYRYPHDEPGGKTDQPLLPPPLQDRRFYYPTGRGEEGVGNPGATNR